MIDIVMTRHMRAHPSISSTGTTPVLTSYDRRQYAICQLQKSVDVTENREK